MNLFKKIPIGLENYYEATTLNCFNDWSVNEIKDNPEGGKLLILSRQVLVEKRFDIETIKVFCNDKLFKEYKENSKLGG